MKKIFVLLVLLSAPAFAARRVVPYTSVQSKGVLWAWTASDTVNGNVCQWSQAVYLLADNSAGASAVTITIYSGQKDDGDLTAPARVVTLAAGKLGIMGPLNAYYAQSDATLIFDSSGPVNFACLGQ